MNFVNYVYPKISGTRGKSDALPDPLDLFDPVVACPVYLSHIVGRPIRDAQALPAFSAWVHAWSTVAIQAFRKDPRDGCLADPLGPANRYALATRPPTMALRSVRTT